MKINLEIELPYITEDGEIENDIQEQIVKGAINKMYQSLDAKIKPIIDKAAVDLVKQKVEEILTNFMEKPVVISTGYKAENYASVLEMVEQKFTALYDMKFAQTGTCNGQDPILKKMEDKIKYQLDSLVSNMNSKIEREAKNIAEKTIKESSMYQVLEKAGIIKG